MASSTRSPKPAGWRAQGLRYHALGFYLRRTFGGRVRKIAVDAGFGCPNRDGTLGTTGCVFCDPAAFSPSRRTARAPLAEQIDRNIEHARARFGAECFIVYFQPGTNTYAPLDQLRGCFETALGRPEVVGLAVGTRPDCVGPEVLDLAAEMARRKWFCFELGLQSAHEQTLRWIGRGHDFAAFEDAVARSHQRGLRIVAHVILGLPGEGPEHMTHTARQVARLGVHGVKLHNLHAVKDTPLAELVGQGRVRLPERVEYVDWVVRFLEELPAECVIDRLSADAPREYLVGPEWCLEKAAVRAAVESELIRRNTWQGAKHAGQLSAESGANHPSPCRGRHLPPGRLTG